MRTSRIAIAALATLVGTLVGDGILATMDRTGTADFDSRSFFVAEAGGRLLTVAAIVAMAWLIFRGPRARRTGAALFVGGLIVALTPLIFLTVSAGEPVATKQGGAGLTLWMASAIAMLGLGAMVWPRAQAVRAPEAAEPTPVVAGAGPSAEAEPPAQEQIPGSESEEAPGAEPGSGPSPSRSTSDGGRGL